MRLKVYLDSPHETVIPLNYQHFLTSAVYQLLATSDADYARFLHDDGYALGDGPKRFKMFAFSWLHGRRRVCGDSLYFAPGPVTWQIASPVADFLTHGATGLLALGHLRVGSASFPITQIETLPPPTLDETMRFTCLSPIVAARPLPNGGARFLRPSDGAEFSDAVRANLLRKHQTLHGRAPVDDRFALTFDPAYLARTNGGTKLITYQNIHIVGAFAPFTASGSAELMRVGYETGLGEKNAAGFGMVEAVAPLRQNFHE